MREVGAEAAVRCLDSPAIASEYDDGVSFGNHMIDLHLLDILHFSQAGKELADAVVSLSFPGQRHLGNLWKLPLHVLGHAAEHRVDVPFLKLFV